MAAASGRAPPLPPRARAYVAAVVAVGAVSLAVSAWAVPDSVRGADPLHLWGGLSIVVGAHALLMLRRFNLPFQGHRWAIHAEEAVVLVGFYHLPAPPVVLASAAGTLLAQVILRKPPVKAAFNTALQGSVVGLAAVALVGLTGVGVPLLAAVFATPLLVNLNHIVTAGLFTILPGGGPGVFRLRDVLPPVLFSFSLSLVFGSLALALMALHPAALLLLVPLAVILQLATAGEYGRQDEVVTRRALSLAARRIVGESREGAVVREVFRVCRDAFNLRAMTVAVEAPGERPRRWDMRMTAGGADGGVPIRVELEDADGVHMGFLELTVETSARSRLELDHERATLVASYLAIALETSRAVRRARAAEARLRDVLDAARDPILILDGRGRVAYANRVATDVLGAGAGDASDVLLARAADDAARERLAASLAAGPVAGGLVAADLADAGGAPRSLEFSFTPISLGRGDRGALLLGRDLTERRALEREAEAQREAAVRAERLSSLGTLVAGVAHEVNNPLMYLCGNIELALMDLAEAEAEVAAAGLPPAESLAETRRVLEKSLEGGQRIARITKELKTIARGGGRQDRAVVDVNEVVRVVEDVMNVGVPAGVAVVYARAECPLPVWGSASEIHQVVLNLARNAVEIVQERGGRVEVTTRVEGDEAVVTVADDGPGIPPDVRERLFTPFFTTKAEGTGLGLSIVQAIVKDHGGTVGVESEPGRGAAFTVRLPLRSA